MPPIDPRDFGRLEAEVLSLEKQNAEIWLTSPQIDTDWIKAPTL